MQNFTNTLSQDRHLIVLSVPPIWLDNYYKDVYEQILAFDIEYAKKVIGKDNIIILGDKNTLNELSKSLPEDVLLEGKMEDIWMRDFTTANPYQPVQFRYTYSAQGGSQRDADYVQSAFNSFTKKYDISYKITDYMNDGGNVVDNYKGRAVVTSRFLYDNFLTYNNYSKGVLKKLLNVQEVAIIEPDDDLLAHADGMVMFIDDDVLVVNRYQEKAYRRLVLDELKFSFPGIKIIEIDLGIIGEAFDSKFGNACGVYVNSVLTEKYLYIPGFGTEKDKEIVELLQPHTSREIVMINALR
eukprot:TRINITY_DN7899_c0_g1_i7.p1 TRINITY_DN7899_c0_g1~~TRINITY_DN7899_c0_g1_i7.p1  ORF type:complete len:344 (-),score=37.95 TRINITY_DN7899_c0_g1_i7:80-973(-)